MINRRIPSSNYLIGGQIVLVIASTVPFCQFYPIQFSEKIFRDITWELSMSRVEKRYSEQAPWASKL